MKDLIKVRIDKADLQKWYSKEVGREYIVNTQHPHDGWYRVGNTGNYILQSDCTVIQDNTEKEEPKDKFQPDEWVVWSGRDPIVAQIKKRVLNDYNGECYELKTDRGHNSCSHLYLRKALPQEIPAPESKAYCIKRTPENAELLNKWMENISIVKNYPRFDVGYVYSIPIDGSHNPYLGCGVREGFTELFTVEEFFAKVGYAPEKVSAPIEEQRQEHPLWKHMNDEHGLILLESELHEIIHIVNEMQNQNSVEQKEESERIPFDLKLWESGKYDVVQRNGLPAEILKTDLKSDQTIVASYMQDSGTENVTIFSSNGRYLLNDEDESDLFLIPKTETVWVNRYFDNEPFKSFDKAKANIAYHPDLNYIDTIELIRPIKYS